MVNTEIRLIIFFAANDGEALYSQQKQDQELTVAQIMNSLRNIGAPQYIRQTLTDIKGEIDSNSIIVGDFNTPLTPMDSSSKQKINKETQVLNDTSDEMDFIDVFRIFHPNAE